MPFQSEKQRRYLWANEPEIARDWTDTYGSRIQKDNGGIMHQFENYAHDDRDNVSVPRSFQARPHSDPVNLAYITPREEGILQNLKPGTPHRGPMEIPNYDSFDVSGGYATSGQLDAPTRGDIQAGVGSGGAGAGGQRTHIGPLSSGAQQAWKDTQAGRDEYKKREALNLMNAQDVWGMPAFQKTTQMYKPRNAWQKFNPLRLLGGAFKWPGRIASGIMGLGKDWAGKMRGGINPETGRYYTQQEYEQNRRARINQTRISNILGRNAPITNMTLQNLRRLGYTGEMPGVGSTGTSRAIDRNVSMQDVLRERPFSTNRLREIQNQWDNQGITGTQAYEDFSPNVALSKQMGSLQADAIPYEEFMPNELAEVERDDLSDIEGYMADISQPDIDEFLSNTMAQNSDDDTAAEIIKMRTGNQTLTGKDVGIIRKYKEKTKPTGQFKVVT